MSAIKNIDSRIKKVIFSLFWFFIDPLDKDRLFGQLVDVLERNIDTTNPDKIIAPDHFEVLVNNNVFIKHAHAIKKLESVLAERLQQYAADMDYEINQPRVRLTITSSATIGKRKADIRCWFSDEEVEAPVSRGSSPYRLEIIAGDGKGQNWQIAPGNTYKIGRISSSQICLPFDNISKTQATLYFVSEDNITIVDEGSANGTFLDKEEKPIHGSRELQVGSEIRFCKRDPIIMKLTHAR